MSMYLLMSFTGRFPKDSQLAFLLVLVHYFDQLWPRLPTSHNLPGWKREDFEADHGHACEDAIVIQRTHPSRTFKATMVEAEEILLRLCSDCQEQMRYLDDEEDLPESDDDDSESEAASSDDSDGESDAGTVDLGDQLPPATPVKDIYCAFLRATRVSRLRLK